MARQNYSKKRMLLLIFLGSILRTMYFVYQNPSSFLKTISDADCSVCHNNCPQQRSSYKLQPPENVPATMYKPKGMYEVIRWTQFNEKFVSDIINDEPKLPINGFWNEEIQAVSQVALQYVNAKTNKSWSIVRLANGYVKHDTLQGDHYIVDLDLTRSLEHKICTEKQRFRVEMVHFLNPVQSSQAVVVPNTGKVNLKVFLFATLTSPKLKQLIESFPTEGVELVEVFVIVVTSDKEKDFKEIMTLQDQVAQSAKSRDKLRAAVIVKESSFHRAVILNSVLSKSRNPKDMIMLISEDAIVKAPLIDHCKIIVRPGQRVYFPVPFQQFNRDLVIKGMPPGKSKEVDMEDHNKFTGQWLPYNYDQVCAYQQDLKPALSHLATVQGSFPEQELGKLLNEQFMRQGVEVVRSVSPALYKGSTNARCLYDAKFANNNKAFCLHEKVMGMASKPALGILYLTDIEKKSIKDDR